VRIIARTFFQTSLIGIITAICAFFVLERILQKWMVPVLFPTGGLYTTPKTLRIRIRTRLTALLFACNLVPFFAFLIILSGTYRMDMEPARMLELLRPTFLINSLVFITLGVFVTLLVGKNLTQPFGEIIQVLKNVRSGRLDGKVRVTTNDEIGYTGDVINEMTEGLKERETLRHSLELAREIQQNLLPKTSLSFMGMDIAGRSIYCDQTGGDYFDFFEFDDPHRGKIGLVVGDVSGHGIPSALLMATARAFIRFRTFMPGSIAQALTDVNRQLVRDVGNSGQFMTLFYLVVDPIEKTLNWIRAGHDPAILYDTNKETFEELRGTGIALGVDKDWRYEENQKTGLADGQTIVIGTDGIWEACNSKGEMFGKALLYEIIRKNQQADAGKILDTIIEALERFREGHALEDDVTLIVMKVRSELNL
jgi:sigma-B regulation protein RsbU (phosphoserine phosphatase)